MGKSAAAVPRKRIALIYTQARMVPARRSSPENGSAACHATKTTISSQEKKKAMWFTTAGTLVTVKLSVAVAGDSLGETSYVDNDAVINGMAPVYGKVILEHSNNPGVQKNI